MRALVLWADARSTNLGVRALAEGCSTLVAQAWPGAEVECQNFGDGPAPSRLGTRTAVGSLLSPSRLRGWLGSFDLVVDTRGGDSFTDIYGMRRLVTMNAIAETCSALGVPLVMAPQTIGPFTSGAARVLARRTLGAATLVLARDARSAAVAVELGRPVDALATDVVFALPQPSPSQAARHDVLLNVSGLLWQPNPHVDHHGYRATILALVEALQRAGRRITLLPHVLDSDNADNDLPAVREVAASAAGPLEVVTPATLSDVRSTMAAATLVVGSRMHACLNAISVGTPAVPLAYSRKFAPLLDDICWPHTVDQRHHPDPAAGVLGVAGRQDLAEHCDDTRARAVRALEPVVPLLRGAVAA